MLKGQGSQLFTCYVSLVAPRGFEDGRRQSADATIRHFQFNSGALVVLVIAVGMVVVDWSGNFLRTIVATI